MCRPRVRVHVAQTPTLLPQEIVDAAADPTNLEDEGGEQSDSDVEQPGLPGKEEAEEGPRVAAAAGDGARPAGKANSTNNLSAWKRFTRLYNNAKRYPKGLLTESKDSVFQAWIENGEDVHKVELFFRKRASQIKRATTSEKFLKMRDMKAEGYSDEKIKKIVENARRTNQFITSKLFPQDWGIDRTHSFKRSA